MENKQKHLEFIQNTINRMAGNLFFLRGWVVTMIAALFALATNDANKRYILIAYFPVLIFWILDGYFLSQERLFRSLYDEVRKKKDDEIDFSMDTRKFKKENVRNSWTFSMFSPTLLFFYLPLIGLMLIVMYIIK